MGEEYLNEYGPETPYTLDQQGNKVFKVDPRGNQNVAMNDQFTDDISIYLSEHLDTIEVITPAPLINDEVVNIQTSGVAVPAVGNFLCLKSGVRFSQVEIMSVTPIAGNDYTLGLAMPLDFAFPIGSGCELQNVNMNVDGSTTERIFRIGPGNLDVGVKWDITRLIPTMILSTAGDDGKFGNLSELTNGVVYRIEDSDDGTKNLFNARTNGDFADESGGDVTYPIRSGGGGDFGMRARITFNGSDKRGIVKRLEVHSELISDMFTARVRDALQTIGRYRTKVQGHVVE